MRRNVSVRARMEGLLPGDCAISSVTDFELFHGLERCSQPERELEKIAELFAVVVVLSFDDAAAKSAAKVRHALEKSGSVIGPFDVLIAGHALASGLVLVTNNTGEFSRVDGLTLEDWQRT